MGLWAGAQVISHSKNAVVSLKVDIRTKDCSGSNNDEILA